MPEINIEYTLKDGLVTNVMFANSGGYAAQATVIEGDNEKYKYSSSLMGDIVPVVAPNPMSLADCILAATGHLGLIPPHNFDPIESPNQH